MSTFAAPHFQSHEAAREWFEAQRWPDGRVCPHCGSINRSYATKRAGLYRCAEPECRQDFTVTMGTVMERSKIKLHKWAMGFYLMASSKKGVSAHQLHRSLGIGYEAAWFMAHRIREAMRVDGGSVPPMGGEGKIVEADETYLGEKENPVVAPRRTTPYTKGGKSGGRTKRTIVGLVERGGSVRTFHVEHATGAVIGEIVRNNVAKESRLQTDESKLYGPVGKEFAAHETVIHSRKEYARGDVTTNTIEGYFGIFKRGMKGVYQHCAEKHLHRYLAEYDFRYNHRIALGINDAERTLAAVKGAEGKRLTYHQTH
ncbi:MAG TPA: IS1595 family transposase [Microvirga sp.]|nr:IS1595 family transposase [Microvirga sp.]